MFHIKWAPILTAAQLVQASNPQNGQQPEALPWFLYDTQLITSGTTSTLAFYQTVQTDKTLGNMESAGQLPDPQYFIIHYATCDILDPPVASAAGTAADAGPINDIDIILKTQRAIFTIGISNKNYGPFPLTLCHATGGATGVIAGTETAPKMVAAGNNGIVGSGGFPFLGSLVLPPKVGFSVNVTMAAAPTLSGNINVRFGLAGVLYRRVL